MPNEIQQFEFSDPLSAGTFTLTLGAETTAPIDWDATTGEIVSALEALTGIGSGNVQVNSWDGTTLVIEFIGALANTNIAQMTCDASSAAYDTGNVTVAITVNGVAGVYEQHQIAYFTPPSAGTWSINGIEVNGGASATANDVEAAIEDAGGANTPCAVTGSGPFLITYDSLSAIADDLLVIDGTLNNGSEASTITTEQEADVGVNEIQRVVFNGTEACWILYDGVYSGVLTGGSSAAEVETALQVIPALTGNVSVSLSPGSSDFSDGVDIEFISGLAETDASTLETRQASGLVLTVPTQYVAPVYQQETITLPADTTGGTWAFNGSAVNLDWDATAFQVETDIQDSLSIQCEVTGSQPVWTVTRDTAGPFSALEIGASNVTGDVTCDESTTQEGGGVGRSNPFRSRLFRSNIMGASVA